MQLGMITPGHMGWGFLRCLQNCATPGIRLPQQDDGSETLKFIFPGLTATLFKFIFPGVFLSKRLLTESKFGINGIQANS